MRSNFPQNLLLSTLLALIGMPSFGIGQEREIDDRPSISVSGHGEVQRKPDMAAINLGVTTQNEDAAVAVRENSETMDRLLRDLKGRGIATKDLQTVEFSISPQYHHDQSNRRQASIVGYNVTNRVHVRVRDLTRLGDILNEVTRGGANQVHGIEFTISDPENAKDEARRSAVADARRKAELYADAAGVKVGAAIRISEFGNSQPPQPQMRMMAMAESRAVPMESGELDVTADVSITYEIR